jgi:ParB family chromosome partitioning protein
MSELNDFRDAMRVTKRGRPTLRKDGRPLTDAERQARRRKRLRRSRRLTSGHQEWYTPPEYVEAARSALGTIDIDPASSETAQRGAFFTVQDDGLAREWAGNVWLNPPYARDLIDRFVDKLLSEIAAGRTQQAIMLTNACTDAAWFRRALAASSAVCLTKRIRFWAPDGRPSGSPTQGQSIMYYGPAVERFKAAFAGFGICR